MQRIMKHLFYFLVLAGWALGPSAQAQSTVSISMTDLSKIEDEIKNVDSIIRGERGVDIIISWGDYIEKEVLNFSGPTSNQQLVETIFKLIEQPKDNHDHQQAYVLDYAQRYYDQHENSECEMHLFIDWFQNNPVRYFASYQFYDEQRNIYVPFTQAMANFSKDPYENEMRHYFLLSYRYCNK
jgi:hypothetical protein